MIMHSKQTFTYELTTMNNLQHNYWRDGHGNVSPQNAADSTKIIQKWQSEKLWIVRL